ncbi:deoxynucleoside kinase [Candidatus Woesearchaeota archaeon]|nr:deoxynucleoside kinase [Candidatus Woesearchaeota archaeon]
MAYYADNLRIAVTGNIGSGKSTLCDFLSSPRMKDTLLRTLPPNGIYGVHQFSEIFNDAGLADFYKDPKAHAFEAQIEFFNGRLEREHQIRNCRGIVLEDRTLREDYFIFGMAQRELGHMSEAQFAVYQRTFDLMTREIEEPDLMVYLRADIDTLMSRISTRGRDMEKQIPREYIEKLNQLYEAFVAQHITCPVIFVDANEDIEERSYLEDTAQKIVDTINRLDLRIRTPGLIDWISLPETLATSRAIHAENILREYLAAHPSLITIAGNVALGKSSLTANLAQALDLQGLYENPEKNPLLYPFLADKPTHCLQLQRNFLEFRSAQRIQGKSGNTSYIKDRSLPEDILAFSRAFKEQGILKPREYDVLMAEFRRANEQLPQADLMIHLKAPGDFSWQRILQRGRPAEIEGGWTPEEINALAKIYQTFTTDVVTSGFHKGPIIEIPVQHVDTNLRIHLGYVCEQMYQALSGKRITYTTNSKL